MSKQVKGIKRYKLPVIKLLSHRDEEYSIDVHTYSIVTMLLHCNC